MKHPRTNGWKRPKGPTLKASGAPSSDAKLAGPVKDASAMNTYSQKMPRTTLWHVSCMARHTRLAMTPARVRSKDHANEIGYHYQRVMIHHDIALAGRYRERRRRAGVGDDITLRGRGDGTPLPCVREAYALTS